MSKWRCIINKDGLLESSYLLSGVARNRTGEVIMVEEKIKPLSKCELGDLARFNAEASRGIMHTSEYTARMVALQNRYNEAN